MQGGEEANDFVGSVVMHEADAEEATAFLDSEALG